MASLADRLGIPRRRRLGMTGDEETSAAPGEST
jgi:hypothetical protein